MRRSAVRSRSGPQFRTFQLFRWGQDRMLAAPRGAARKELSQKIPQPGKRKGNGFVKNLLFGWSKRVSASSVPLFWRDNFLSAHRRQCRWKRVYLVLRKLRFVPFQDFGRIFAMSGYFLFPTLRLSLTSFLSTHRKAQRFEAVPLVAKRANPLANIFEHNFPFSWCNDSSDMCLRCRARIAP